MTRLESMTKMHETTNSIDSLVQRYWYEVLVLMPVCCSARMAQSGTKSEDIQCRKYTDALSNILCDTLDLFLY